MVKIAPSLLAANFDNLEEEITHVVEAGADWIHVDVMDGKFVNNITPGVEMYQRASRVSKVPIDVHLMVENPKQWMEDNIFECHMPIHMVSFHIETMNEKETHEMIAELQKHKIKASLAMKPDTSVEVVKPFLRNLDMVLVMTVEPGYGGQTMIEDCLKKVKQVRKWNREIDIEVDGGINLDTVKRAKGAGANIIVAGTAIFKAEHPKEVIQKMKQ